MNDPTSEYLSSDLLAELLARWGEPHRRYHTVEHLAAVLQALDVLADAGAQFDRKPVELAAWFHDAIYQIGSPDNEAESARLASRKVCDPATAAEVARLVRTTADHRPGRGDRNAAALCDADLAVLAGAEREYVTYAKRVRDEYCAVPNDTFNAGRARLLATMLDADTLFHTEYGKVHWEHRARQNVASEIARLRSTQG